MNRKLRRILEVIVVIVFLLGIYGSIRNHSWLGVVGNILLGAFFVGALEIYDPTKK